MKNSITSTLFLATQMLWLLAGCNTKPERDFFTKMETSYPVFKTKARGYLLNGFGLKREARKINGNYYWELTGDMNSFFYLAGNLRYSNDSILYLPKEYKKGELENAKDQMLFNFSKDCPKYWKIFEDTDGKERDGDSIVRQVRTNQTGEEEYFFDIYPFYFHPEYNLDDYKGYYYSLKVSKSQGITEIHGFYTDIKDPLFHIIFLPEIKYIEGDVDVYLL